MPRDGNCVFELLRPFVHPGRSGGRCPTVTHDTARSREAPVPWNRVMACRRSFSYLNTTNPLGLMNRIVLTFYATLLVVALLGCVPEANAQHDAAPAGEEATITRLVAPGNAIFGAVQEVIQRVEADTTVDWSAVNLERLRRHLIDMRRVATNVEVVYQHAIEEGVLIRIVPEDASARSSLARVLRDHAPQLEREAGWSLTVEPAEDGYDLQVTTSDPADVPKIRALGYIGLLAYGAHHQQHHWMIATGQASN